MQNVVLAASQTKIYYHKTFNHMALVSIGFVFWFYLCLSAEQNVTLSIAALLMAIIGVIYYPIIRINDNGIFVYRCFGQVPHQGVRWEDVHKVYFEPTYGLTKLDEQMTLIADFRQHGMTQFRFTLTRYIGSKDLYDDINTYKPNRTDFFELSSKLVFKEPDIEKGYEQKSLIQYGIMLIMTCVCMTLTSKFIDVSYTEFYTYKLLKNTVFSEAWFDYTFLPVYMLVWLIPTVWALTAKRLYRNEAQNLYFLYVFNMCLLVFFIEIVIQSF